MPTPTSLYITKASSVSGRAKGITGNPALLATVAKTLNASFSSVGTGATLIHNGYAGTRTLAAGANETLDLRAFTNLLNETAQSLSKLKIIGVKHTSTSAASNISVGNSGANALIVKGCLGATAAQFAPGGGLEIVIPTSAGVVVDATHKDVKIVNDDGSNIATYEIWFFGET